MGSLGLFLLSCIMALFGTLYSAPPFRLKMVYPFSTMIQFAGCFLPFLAGVAFISIVTFQTIIISSVFAALAMIHRFEHEIKNYKADVQTGKKTVAVIRGLRTAQMLLRLCAFVGVAEFAAFFILGWLNMVLLFLFVLYVFAIILSWRWLSYVPPSLRTVFARLEMVSSFILLFIVLLVYRKF
jgi:4-hydroxybenzoate polyprenyltransferase